MLLRVADEGDIPTLASIGVSAFSDDPIYSHFYPFRDLYPEDFYNGIVQSLQDVFYQPGGEIVVAESDEFSWNKDNGSLSTHPRILGYITLIHYTRDGEREDEASYSGHRDTRKPTDGHKDKQDHAPNRAEAPGVIQAYYSEVRAIQGSVSNTIETKSMAILPEFQRKGIGRKLLEWAIEKSEESSALLIGDAAEKGKGISLYNRLGQKPIGMTRLSAKTFLLKEQPEAIEVPEVVVLVLCRYPTGYSRSD